MKRINYTVARLVSITAYALLVFVFCAIMIAQLEKNIEQSGLILASAKENSEKLESISSTHHEVVALVPFKGGMKDKDFENADGKIVQILNDINKINYPNLRDLEQSYFAARILIEALKVEYAENPYSEEAQELLEGIHYNLTVGIKEVVRIMNTRTEELRAANEESNELFINLRKYMLNFCIVIGVILLGSAIYLNSLLRQPVRELAKAADEIRSGNLEYTLDVRDIPRDELGMLMRNFNVMARRLSHTASRLEDANKNLKEEADVLNAVSKQKTKFIRHLGHELRAPLSSIIGFAELMLEGFYGDLTEKQEDYLGRITRSANHLLALVNDLVDQAKMQAGTLRLDYEDFEIVPFVQEIFHSFEASAEKEGITFLFKHDKVPEKAKISFDGKRIRQAIINLISNALKFTPDGETVLLSIRVKDQNLIVNVTDTGIGIAEDDLEDIFLEFKQAETLKTSEGAGLGLPLSRQLVIMHGGDITVKSELGEGACFSLVVPLKRPEDMPDIMETSYDIL